MVKIWGKNEKTWENSDEKSQGVLVIKSFCFGSKKFHFPKRKKVFQSVFLFFSFREPRKFPPDKLVISMHQFRKKRFFSFYK